MAKGDSAFFRGLKWLLPGMALIGGAFATSLPSLVFYGLTSAGMLAVLATVGTWGASAFEDVVTLYHRRHPPTQPDDLPVRVLRGRTRRHPMEGHKGRITMTGWALYNGTQDPLTVEIRFCYYPPRGYHASGVQAVAGPHQIEIRPKSWTYLPTLEYEVGPYDEAPYWNAGAKLVLSEPHYTREKHVCLFTRGTGKECSGEQSLPILPGPEKAEWKQEGRRFRDGASLLWNTYGSPPHGSALRGLVDTAPWPDSLDRKSETEQKAESELLAFATKESGHPGFVPIAHARSRMDELVLKWLQRMREIDGFTPWLRNELAWPELHAPTLKLLWYLGNTAVKDTAYKPDYSGFSEFRDRLDGTEVSRSTLARPRR